MPTIKEVSEKFTKNVNQNITKEIMIKLIKNTMKKNPRL